MNLSIDSLKTSEQEVTGYYMECHGPGSRCQEEIDKWVKKCIDMLGPDDCMFLVRSRAAHLSRLWMARGSHLFVPSIADAGRYEWGEAAVKITNNTKLEAVRIISDHEAVASDGTSYKMMTRPVGPTATPDYQGRWELNYADEGFVAPPGEHDFGGIGTIGQNGEQLPGSTNE